MRVLGQPWLKMGAPRLWTPIQLLPHSPFLAGQGERIGWEHLWIKIKTVRLLTYYCRGQRRLELDKTKFIANDNRFCKLEIKTNFKKTPFLPLFSCTTSFLHSRSLTPTPEQHWGGGVGEGDCHSDFSLLFLPSHTFPLLRHGLSPWAAVLQEEPAPAWPLHWPKFLQEVSNCSTAASSMSCRGYLLKWHKAPPLQHHKAPSSLTLVFPLLFLTLFVPTSSLRHLFFLS